MENPGAKKQRKLGKGLSALMQTSHPIEVAGPQTSSVHDPHQVADTDDQSDAPQRVVSILLDLITPSPFQPRTAFDEAELAQLADSIRQAGVIQPILVRRSKRDAGRYELIAGERRWRAARIAGIKSVPALVVPLEDEQAAEWALVENLQRTDLNPIERGLALRNLSERFGLSQAQIAERVGLDRSSVANLVRLTDLETEIQNLIVTGSLSAGHGKALLALEAGPQRIEAAARAAKEGWTVRRLEAYARTNDGAKPSHQNTRAASPTLVDLERRLGEHLGTRVRITTSRDGTRGRVSMEFYSLDHFDGLMQKMNFNPSGD